MDCNDKMFNIATCAKICALSSVLDSAFEFADSEISKFPQEIQREYESLRAKHSVFQDILLEEQKTAYKKACVEV